VRFFDKKGEKIGVFEGNFPDPEMADSTRPRSKMFDPDPSLILALNILVYILD